LFCGKVKEFLSRKGVAYTERDISRDQQALDELSRLGYMTTPVTTIDGEVVVGFDQKRLEALLS
jgi:glutaredoxin